MDVECIYTGLCCWLSDDIAILLIQKTQDTTCTKERESHEMQISNRIKISDRESCNVLSSLVKVCKLDHQISVSLNGMQTRLRGAVVVSAFWEAKRRFKADGDNPVENILQCARQGPV